MPGLFSNVFDGNGDNGASAEAQSTGLGLDVAQDIDLDVAVGVGLEAGGSYQTLDGLTTTWSNSTDVGVDADIDGVLGGSLSQDTVQSVADVGG